MQAYHFNLANSLFLAIGYASAALASAFAWSVGGRVEKLAVAAYASSLIGGTANMIVWELAWGTLRLPLPLGMFWEVYPAAVFLYLAVRHNNLWLGMAAVAQGLEMGLWAVSLVLWEPFGSPGRWVMSLTMATMSYAMMASLVGSAVTHQRRSRAALLASGTPQAA